MAPGLRPFAGGAHNRSSRLSPTPAKDAREGRTQGRAIHHSPLLRFLPIGQILLAFGDVHLSPGSGRHLLMLPVQVTDTWVIPREFGSNAPTLLTGTVWTDQPYFRWLAGVQPQVLTVRGYQVGEELVVDLSNDQLVAQEHARGENDLVLRVKRQATLLHSDRSIHPIAQEETLGSPHVLIRGSAGRP